MNGARKDPSFRAGLALAIVVAMVIIALLATSPPADMVLPGPIAPQGG